MNALEHFITENLINGARAMDALQDAGGIISDNCVEPGDVDPDGAQAAVEWLLAEGWGR